MPKSHHSKTWPVKGVRYVEAALSDLTTSSSYHWSDNRTATNLHDNLGSDFTGTLQCDGYSSYVSYQNSIRGHLHLRSCMAHIRRKFHNALQAKEKHAAHIMQLIALLYQIEENLR